MFNFNKILCGICIVLFLVSAVFISLFKAEQKEKRRIENNYNSLVEGIKEYKTKNGQLATEIIQKELTVSELKKYNKEYVDEINNLGLKLKRTEWLLANKTQTEIIVKDTFILKDTVLIEYKNPKCVTIKDKWYYNMQICTQDSLIIPQHTHISMTDSIFFAAHRVPRFQLWFIRIGTKRIDVNSSNKNPYVKSVFQESIKLK